MLLIDVADTEKYLVTNSGIKQWLMRVNNKYYQTPLSISFATVDYDTIALETLIYNTWHEYRFQHN